MKISTKGRYALRVMIDLAVNDKGDYVSLKDISNRQEVSLKYLEQIMAMLNKAGYVKSTRGNNGGYRLAKSPEEYKVGDILRKTEGDLAPIACVNGEECGKRENCKTFKFWQGLDNVINEYVDSKTLTDLIK
ncbi:MAG TPA: Rrf2 family transcriptional regulator [Clostridiaceae bacterium]|nr:Rrf2 family transcriptional regulator [Clostridiaceae bacterium]